jgi:hypothetical protein
MISIGISTPLVKKILTAVAFSAATGEECKQILRHIPAKLVPAHNVVNLANPSFGRTLGSANHLVLAPPF